MSLLKDLYLFKDEGIDDTLVYVDQCYKFVKERVSENDHGNVTRTNFLEELRRHKDGIKSLSHGTSITATSVLRYIFRHFDDFNICHSIGTEMAKTIFVLQKNKQELYWSYTRMLPSYSLGKLLPSFKKRWRTMKMISQLSNSYIKNVSLSLNG